MQHKTPTALWLALAIGLPATTAQAAQDRDLFTHGPKDTNPNFVEPEA
ncbi:MAG TPA: hypothetical protein VLM84_09450 [Chromatiaceae bacterium]|nr:hypothetical protein [Chromatiaceae bacterium]